MVIDRVGIRFTKIGVLWLKSKKKTGILLIHSLSNTKVIGNKTMCNTLIFKEISEFLQVVIKIPHLYRCVLQQKIDVVLL
jgi:hypothetical protein